MRVRRFGTLSDYMEAREDRVVIEHVKSAITGQEDSSVAVRYRDITDILYQPCGAAMGYLEVKCPENRCPSGGELFTNPYLVRFFGQREQEEAIQFRDFLARRVAQAKGGPQP